MVCLGESSNGLFDELSTISDGGKQEKAGNQRSNAANKTSRTFQFIKMGGGSGRSYFGLLLGMERLVKV